MKTPIWEPIIYHWYILFLLSGLSLNVSAMFLFEGDFVFMVFIFLIFIEFIGVALVNKSI